ncbi:MAG TPA: TetR/AcrR family transcriptional regulator [Acidimicrobiales bacterium]|nr:TetR/AcrR family transcriptional regulator [Acidimicrobiales bacterium]
MATRGRGRPAGGDPTVATEHVLDAALEAFAERGYDGTSVRELARELGVSHNLIPQRIGTKEELWYAAVDRGFSALAEALADAAATHQDGDDVARLRALVVRFIEANAARPSLLRLINQEATAPGPRLDHLFEHYIDPVRRFGQDLLERLRAEGQIRTDSVALVYFLMTHGAGGPMALPALSARFGASVDPADPEAVHRHAVEAADVLFDGLRAR